MIYYIFRDNQLIASTGTRQAAIDLIRVHQRNETHQLLKAQFSIIAGEQEFIDYPRRSRK